ncbi:SAM-dependent methyltransferase [Pseudonocardia lacus]|uniref:SAM-dependent methyltransferase n=1 Tax=Pseudonocardia lacus TaxID=2835865 RepID=UPI001BDDA28C|nr:methyltransferase domain-containing protein [Pseudonocardia lacus]
MPIDLPPPHDDLTFMAPLSPERAARLVGFLAHDLRGTVADIGCGWAELLLRVLVAAPDARGIGIDTDAAAIAHGRVLAERRGLAERVDLRCADASTPLDEPVDAVICIGASQVWGAPVSDAEPLDYAAALTALRDAVPRGGRVLYGEGIWSRPPTEAAAAPLAGRLDEFLPLAGLVDLATAHGFAPLAVHEASLDEWDEFESGFSARYARWLAAHAPDHPDADEVRARAARQRAGYFGGYRGVLGLAYLGLLAV